MAGAPLIGPESTDIEQLLGWLQTAWERLPAAVVLTRGPEHHVVFRNAAFRELFGPAALGTPLLDTFRGRSPINQADLDRVLGSGRPLVRGRRRMGVRDTDERQLHMRYVVSPYGPPEQPPVGLVISAVDLSGEARAELASNRAGLTARVSDQMNSASDAASALQALTDCLVPELADVAAVYALSELPHGHALLPSQPGVPVAISTSPALRHLGPPPVTAQPRLRGGPWDGLLASGRAVIMPFEQGDPAEVVPDEVARAWLSAAVTRNLVAVPMAVAGRLVSVLVLISTGDRQPYGPLILPFLSDLAARAGVAVEQVRQHRLQARVSHQLQQALLPAAPPQVAGLRVAARYLAGAEGVDVGGDWWDVVRLDADHVAMGVGDACGRGVDAAVVMGQARAAMRAAALAGLSPARVLELTDRHLTELATDIDRHTGYALFATALHAVTDLNTGRTVLASAGHPPAMIRESDGSCRIVASPPGPPLGLDVGGYTETELVIRPGSTLLMYTDGLVEDRNRDLDTGLDQLTRAFAAHGGQDIEASLDAILAALVSTGSHGPAGADDIAAVLVHRDGADSDPDPG